MADISINIAAGLILIQVFRGVRLDGTREKAEAAPGDEKTDEQPEESAP